MNLRILYLSHPESDYGGAFLYNGLCEVVGAHNVIDFPEKKSYHGIVHRYALPDIPNGMTGPLAWFPDGTPSVWPGDSTHEDHKAEVLRALRNDEYAFVVIESPRWVALKTYNELIGECPKMGQLPTVLHDGEDFYNMGKAVRDIKPDIYLKREVHKDRNPIERVLMDSLLQTVMAFPFSCPSAAVDRALSEATTQESSYDYDVALLFGATSPIRHTLFYEFRKVQDMHVYSALSGDNSIESMTLRSWADYIRLMSRSRVAVSAMGYGIDTCRYWEVAAVTALLCDDVDLCIPHPFSHNETCLMYRSSSDAVNVARHAVKDGTYQAIAERGRRHLRTYHTNRARAEYLLDYMMNEGLLKP